MSGHHSQAKLCDWRYLWSGHQSCDPVQGVTVTTWPFVLSAVSKSNPWSKPAVMSAALNLSHSNWTSKKWHTIICIQVIIWLSTLHWYHYMQQRAPTREASNKNATRQEPFSTIQRCGRLQREGLPCEQEFGDGSDVYIPQAAEGENQSGFYTTAQANHCALSQNVTSN